MLASRLASSQSITPAYIPDMVCIDLPSESRPQASRIQFFGDLIVTIFGVLLANAHYAEIGIMRVC